MNKQQIRDHMRATLAEGTMTDDGGDRDPEGDYMGFVIPKLDALPDGEWVPVPGTETVSFSERGLL